MLKFHRNENGTVIAEITDKSLVIKDVQDILDLLGDIGANGCDRLIIHENNLSKEFFSLRGGLAGELLQKFSTYRISLAIVGDFKKYQSPSLQDFIRECNRGYLIHFVDDLEFAIKKLSEK
jgi:hypothetical protein